MCSNKDCGGDPHAPDKWSCRACYGAKYKCEEERKEEARDWYAEQKADEACMLLKRAARLLTESTGITIPYETVYAVVDAAGSKRASALIRNTYHG